MSRNRIFELVVVGLIVWVVTGGMLWILERAKSGFLISTLGGITQSDVKILNHALMSLDNAVIAFDREKGCPDSSQWAKFTQLQSRTIIGAKFADREVDPSLSEYVFGQKGGKEKITITVSQIPDHQHDYLDVFWSENREGDRTKDASHPREVGVEFVAVPGKLGIRGVTDGDNEGWARETTTVDRSLANGNRQEQVLNLQPFVALYFCKFTHRDST